MCKNFKEKGSCKYGDRCLFAHGDHELIKRGQVPTTNSDSKSKEADEEKKKSELDGVKTPSDHKTLSNKSDEKVEIREDEAQNSPNEASDYGD